MTSLPNQIEDAAVKYVSGPDTSADVMHMTACVVRKVPRELGQLQLYNFTTDRGQYAIRTAALSC